MATGLGTVSGSVLIVPNVIKSASDTVFRKTQLINALRASGKVVSPAGSSPFKVNIIQAANGSVSDHTEGETITSFGNQTYIQGSVDAFWVKGAVSITGHMRANLENGGTYGDVWQQELDKTAEDVLKAVEDRLCGTTQDVGIRYLVDSTGTSQGINPSTYTNWASYELSMSGSTLLDTMDSVHATLQAGPYVTDLNSLAIFAHPSVVQKYVKEKAANLRGNYGDAVDFGTMGKAPTYNARPVFGVAGLATTEMLFVDMSRIELRVHQELQPRAVNDASNDDKQMLFFACGLVTEARNAHAKITGIT